MGDCKANLLLPIAASLLIIDERPTSDRQPVKLSLVLPTFNEGANIREIVGILSELLDRVMPADYELIVVDDDSPDRTWELARALMPAGTTN